MAAALSSALLAHSGRSAQSALERCLSQLARPVQLFETQAQDWMCLPARVCLVR